MSAAPQPPIGYSKSFSDLSQIRFRNPFDPKNKLEPGIINLLPSIVAGASSVEEYKKFRELRGVGNIEFPRFWKAILMVLAVILNITAQFGSLYKYIKEVFLGAISFSNIMEVFWEAKALPEKQYRLEDFKPHLFLWVASYEIWLMLPHLKHVFLLIHALMVSDWRNDNPPEGIFKLIKVGCKSFSTLSTSSGLKYLPRATEFSERFWHAIEKNIQEFAAYLNFPLFEKIMRALCVPVVATLMYLVGAITLYSKIESLEKEVLDKELSRWIPVEGPWTFYYGFAFWTWFSATPFYQWPLFKFLNLVNQIKGVVSIDDVKKVTVEHFVFSGQDAEFDEEEKAHMERWETTLCQQLFQRPWRTYSFGVSWLASFQCAWCGFTAYNTVTAKDLQRLVLYEKKNN